jgi:hypothetical protein
MRVSAHERSAALDALRRLVVAGVVVAAAWICGCSGHAGGQDPITGVNPDGSPRWVNRGSGAFDGEHGKAFYGVGIVRGVRNPGLERETADNRARAEIGKIFHTYIAALMSDYQRSTTAGDFSASAEEQDITSTQKTLTEVTLRGVQIKDHWRDPRDGSMYALAVLDLNSITGALDRAQSLSARVRDFVRANARRAFEDLDRELDRRSQPADPAPEPQPQDSPAAAVPERLPPPAASAAPVEAPRSGKVRVGLRIQGTKASIIQTCFANKLVNAGYDLYEGTSDVDVMVRGKLSYQKAGNIDGSEMVKATAEVRVSDMESGRTSAAVVEKIRVGRPTLQTAVQLAVSRLCDRIVPKIVQQIEGGIVK